MKLTLLRLLDGLLMRANTKVKSFLESSFRREFFVNIPLKPMESYSCLKLYCNPMDKRFSSFKSPKFTTRSFPS